jgi:glyoxylase-like metal-dependent hydrolase (beta-lactamase superfamily II)
MKQEIIRIDLDKVNCYLAKSEEGFVLFDTGGYITLDKQQSNRREALVRELDKAGCKPGNLKAIILTHGDNDHVTNAAYLRDKYKTIIAIHKDDKELVENVTVDRMMANFRFQSLVLILISKLMSKQIRKMNANILENYTNFTPDIYLKEGDNLSQYGFDARIIDLPGHTAGSIGILFGHGELISGDIFANNKKPAYAPNALDFKQMKNSAKKLLPLKITKVYPGHGDPFEFNEIAGRIR